MICFAMCLLGLMCLIHVSLYCVAWFLESKRTMSANDYWGGGTIFSTFNTVSSQVLSIPLLFFFRYMFA